MFLRKKVVIPFRIAVFLLHSIKKKEKETKNVQYKQTEPTQLSEELEEEQSSTLSKILIETTPKKQESKSFPHNKYYTGFLLL